MHKSCHKRTYEPLAGVALDPVGFLETPTLRHTIRKQVIMKLAILTTGQVQQQLEG